MSFVDRVILGIVNLLVYVRYARLIRKFRKIVGYFPNVSAPRRYHELMIWRKIFDHNPLFVTFCDKLATKDYVQSFLPEVMIPRTLWIGRDVTQIPLSLRNENVVLKANHGSSYNYFGAFGDAEMEGLKKLTSKWLRTNYGRSKYEWGYFGARRLLFLEERLVPPAGESLLDISIRCSDGTPLLCSAIVDNKQDAMRMAYFESDGTRIVQYEAEMTQDSRLPDDFELPHSFFLAVEYAKCLSRGIDYARYDFLCACNSVYAGEITLYPSAGMTHVINNGLNERIFKGWDVTRSWFMQTNHAGFRSVYARSARKHFAELHRR